MRFRGAGDDFGSPVGLFETDLAEGFFKGIFQKGCLKRDVVEGFLGFVAGDDLDTPVGFFENGFRVRT